jgi:leader peptidase (prepilin peptidase)/N-methyltransferase
MDSYDWARIIPPWLFPAWATALGLVLGSFANVCIHRLPERRNVLWGRSLCPACGHRIRAVDNLPLVSWIWLRGRCRDCGAGISWRYPLVELVTGLLCLALALRFGPGSGFAVMTLFGLALVILFFTDLETMLLPDAVTLTGTVLGVLLASWNPLLAEEGTGGSTRPMLSAIGGALAGAGLVLVIMLGWRLWTRGRLGPEASEEERSGMGQGDLKMLALIGAFVGLRQVFVVTFVAAMLGSAVGLLLLAVRGGGRRTVLPFGTFLALAALATIFYGQAALAWYLRLLGLP